jgi:hypothetical protein
MESETFLRRVRGDALALSLDPFRRIKTLYAEARSHPSSRRDCPI